MKTSENTVTERRVNPLVDRFVTTDLPLLAILESAPAGRPPVVTALLAILESLAGRRLARDAFGLAQAVPLEDTDPEMRILLLANWADLLRRVGRPSEAETLLQRTRAFVTPDTHPEVRAFAMLAESALADTLGDKLDAERKLKEILSFVSSHSPRRKFYAWEWVLLLARQGRGTELTEELRTLTWQCNERFRSSRLHMAQFVNAVETGDIQDAARLVPQIAPALRSEKELARIPYRGYQALLRLMHVGREPPPTEAAAPSDGVETPGFLWVDVARRLLDRDPERALQLARTEANRLMGSILAAGFESFSLIRAELSAGKPQAARHLLEMRKRRGNTHYLDDFFLARIEWAERNPKAAALRFATALKSVENYQARGRLDFELRLSCELSHGDIVELTRAAEKSVVRAANAGRHAAPVSVLGTSGARSESDPPDRAPAPADLIGTGPAMRTVRDWILRYADLDAPILITGETGTGKEVVARSIHARSRRAPHLFTPVNCGALTETLLESELFGHERGAFTGADRTTAGLFEATGKGTLFLDEIGEISPRLQSVLLRVLETGEIRAVGSARTRQTACRVLAATNADLDELADRGLFRKDLLFRLRRLTLHVPPLRERGDDIPALLRHFLDLDRRIGEHATFTKALLDALRAYPWPGNVREFRNAVERMRLLHSDKLRYDVQDLDVKLQPSSATGRESPVEMETRAASAHPAAGPALTTAPADPESVADLIRGGRSAIRRADRLRDLFKRHGKLTRGELIRILGVSPNTATKDLLALCEEGFVERVEPSASTRSHYFRLKHPEGQAG